MTRHNSARPNQQPSGSPPRVPLCAAVAEALAAEDIRLAFGLMGNGNMYVMEAVGRSVRVIHARHEHAAVTMADGFARHTLLPGVALVTNGPGFTQIMTALTVAVRARSPVVVLAGDSCQTLPFHIHTIDQAPLAVATGATYIALRNTELWAHDIARAFHLARTAKTAVVVGIPEDLQRVMVAPHYVPSTRFAIAPQRPAPDPAAIVTASAWLQAARRPVVIAGRGAVRAGAAPALQAIADRVGGLLATSLLAQGVFAGHDFNIGVAGGLATPLARALLAEADVVLAVGARLGHYTTEGGRLFASAKVIQVTLEPEGMHEGVRTADLHILGDAAVTVQSLLDGLPADPASGWRNDPLRDRIAGHVADPAVFAIAPGELDPRAVMARIDALIPKDWEIVCGLGHFFFFAMAHLTGRDPGLVHVISEFGTIGSALSIAIGIAAERGDGRVLLIDGDGSMMMHIQEIETARRHRVRLLILTLNDGAYGAELHKLRAQGIDTAASLHGRCDLAGVARAFGLAGAAVVSLDGLEDLFADYLAAGVATLWDIAVSDAVPAPQYRW